MGVSSSSTLLANLQNLLQQAICSLCLLLCFLGVFAVLLRLAMESLYQDMHLLWSGTISSQDPELFLGLYLLLFTAFRVLWC